MRPFALVVCILAACSPARPPEDESSAANEKSPAYAREIQVICDVDRLSGADPEDPLTASKTREDYLLAHIKDPDAIYFLTVFRSKDAATQAGLLAQEKTELGLKRCPLADALHAAG